MIVVLGELGVGKIVSVKYIMCYFVMREVLDDLGVCIKCGVEVMSEIEEQILVMNLIMEVFGNVKMIRNDNLLCFGKYIEIMFDELMNIIGVKICIYFFE